MGWVGNVFLIIGLFFINPKTRWPFIFTTIGELIWAVYSCYLGHADMIFICLVFAVLGIRNYFKWEQSQ